MAAATIMIAAMAVAAVGSIVSGIQAKKTAEFNASIARQEAETARDRAKFNKRRADIEADRVERNARRRRGRARAVIAQSGILLAGTPTDLLADMAIEEETNIRLTALEGDLALFEGEAAASSKENEASFFQMKGKQAFTKGLFGAGTTILGGAAKGKQSGIF